MSIMGTIYTGLSGLLGFSKGLNVISNNVANMNTPGFKGNDVQFEDLYYQYRLDAVSNSSVAAEQLGSGMRVAGTTMRLAQGEIRETGNATDIAVNGEGYFILRDDNGNTFYTRDGQFDFDAEGYLIAKSNNARVMGYVSSDQLQAISLSDYRTSAPQATSRITFTNNLSTGGTTHSLASVQVYDTTGLANTLSLTFTNNQATTAGSWLVEVRNSANTAIFNGEIRFQGNGSPATGFNELQFDFTPTGSTIAQPITLFFGDAGSLTGATSFSGGTTSTLQTSVINGYGVGTISTVVFDEKGEIKLNYGNGQSHVIGQMALAHFADQQALEHISGGLFANVTQQRVYEGKPTTGLYGKIVAKSIELSNVDLTQQFTDLVIIQRGFQASSQVLTVANEMVQEMLNNLQGKK
jgi:flagellar hook protein FlgE